MTQHENDETTDESLAILLRQGLADEAAGVPVPERYDEIVARAARDGAGRGSIWLVAAVLLLVVGVGIVGLTQPWRSTSATVAAPVTTVDTSRPPLTSPAPTTPGPASTTAPVSPSAGPATASSTAPVTPSAPTATGSSVSAPAIAFASPSGTILCVMGGTRAVNAVDCRLTREPTWRSSMTSCLAPGATVPFSASAGVMTLSAGGPAVSCNGQGFSELRLGSAEAGPYTSWFDPARGTTVALPDGGQAPVLPYGTPVTVGSTSCVIDPAGVTCRRGESAFRLSLETLTLRAPDRQTVYGDAAFATPSGGIVCMVGATALCEVDGPTYTPPATPSSCQLDWGQRLELTTTTRFVCAGDSMLWAARPGSAGTGWWDTSQPTVTAAGVSSVVARYGTTFISQGRTCVVSAAGVSCSTAAGAGFSVSKGRYTTT